ncbi:YggS family pyridoxal phosphate-dependent enzyme [Alteromonas sp. 5E99-2]|uniref:YggS family pyridoxal phosphate-dependent enzyme n=1 Tax=Alteromonas sp. 5E99-2 TaxID=2817683 RepID=UPI001A98D89D|nr:YggS family pyridoxal phosphate-dependent enzyme [Alteromonas sp. 5E99-2]MBO1256388.1 YggS family pyridoxal phosphate-dependent enzyme [Alteromonas sp. 5E99-2]
MQTIAERLDNARKSIKDATINAQRNVDSVQLLAVSKTKLVSEITQAYKHGHRMFGENYIQEGVSKVKEMSAMADIEWHMIGPIQSNKTKDVATYFDWVQSIDRVKIAKRLNDQRPESLPNLNVCIQVNIDDEPTKSGVSVNEVDTLINEIKTMPRLSLRGFMAIPKADAELQTQIASFKKMQGLFTDYSKLHAEFDTLSLGMSNDMNLAIQHGSTMVRLGTAIFGARSYSNN